MEKIKKLAIVAGEASSDLHAAHLIEAIKEISPDIEFFGLGGKKMQEAGVRITYNIVDLAVVGFSEVLKNLSKFKKIFKDFLLEIDKEKPDAVILIDYPGFNLRLAKELKKRNIRVIYYISPQVWAWGKNRIKLIKKCVDRMIVLFKFEEELYGRHDVEAAFVGHPLLDIVSISQDRKQFLNEIGLAEKNVTVSLLPGSREREIKSLLPEMLEAAKIIHDKINNSQFIILQSHSLNDESIKKYTSGYNLPIRICRENTYNGINASDLAISASGTATLEIAILKKPLIIIYKVSFLTWLIAKMLVRLPFIGLVNVVARKKIVPELIQNDVTAKKIAEEALNLLLSPKKIIEMKSELEKLENYLGKPGATKRAAETIINFI